MVNNNNANLTKQGEVDEKSLPKNNSTSQKEEEMDFKELYEQSLNQFQYGDIATGKVVQIKDDRIMVDVGWKTEGFIPIDEIKDARGNINISVGDEIDVFIDRRDSEGNLVLSRDKASKVKIWDEIKNACDNDTIISIIIQRHRQPPFKRNLNIRWLIRSFRWRLGPGIYFLRWFCPWIFKYATLYTTSP